MAERGKTVRLFLIEGTPTGRMKCELSNWTGVAYRIPHTMISKCTDRKELNNTGVYFLIGKDEDGITDKIYIGEAENVLPRINQHIIAGTKEWQDWTDCVIFVNKDDALNKAMVKYLENALYVLAKKANRCTIYNGNTPTKSSLSETDETEMLEYLDNLRLLMGAMGYKFLEEMESVPHKDNNGQLLTLKSPKSTYEATGKVTEDGFIVFKGSKITNDIANSFNKYGYCALREKLIANGTIVNFEFVKDYLFSSCSAASSVIQGHNTNGWIEWKTKDKRTLTDIMRETSE